ncbi:MAG TPA: transglycosylase domain-containing protein [Candidatus Saccharimonadales bacterium]|jgi:penicillin-binding protein 1A|nr:transglycosylase domain-containing protein [Candidatus Saccharimonadales bacterium]
MNRFGPRRKPSGLRVYSNLSARRKQKADVKSRHKAEYLASLPKNPVKRFLYRMHPKRLAAFWFSREGGILALKIAGVSLVLLAILVGGLFAYYRHELDAISPQELAKRVQTTVTRYYDRNGALLWEDKGNGDYKLVVQSNEINDYMKKATVAIEDKDFYNHAGVSPTGILRSFFNNFTGGDTQGGSTLTQQLVKQVFLSDEASKRGINGIPRKIKEIILAIEVERMYNKDQILTLYLNESPYGGPRNGVESAAQTYFGKAAKDLTLPEAAILAAIPQEPGLFNPYNVDGHKALLDRQHEVLDKMATQGYISKTQAEDAKKVAVLDTIKPEQPIIARAPHFVQMVKSQLESELGAATVGRGGLTIKTTLDIRAQDIVESAVSQLFASSSPRANNFDNSAVTVVDVKTGQIIALDGSRDYNYPGYGNVNATEAFIQPGSSIKPFVYSSLFKQKTGDNYGAGTVLSDDPLPQSFYKTDDGTTVMDFDNKFRGNIPIRSALAESRNIPAIKAMYLNDKASGAGDTINTIHAMGDVSYCTDGADKQVGLGAAIGSCGLKQFEHANAFATIARNGVYKPPVTVLEVKNGQGQVLKEWKDDGGKQVIDPQIPSILQDILSDDNARSPSFGHGASGFNVPGVKTGTKSGTSNIGNKSKDLWLNSFSPAIVASVWLGNHDSRPMGSALSSIIGPTVSKIVGPIHTQIYQKDGRWKPGDWFTKAPGLQTLSINGGRPDLFPSWYQKPQAATGTPMVFDSVSKKKATSCTPQRAQTTQTVQTFKDPITQQQTTTAPDGYDPTKDDDVHHCDDVKPFVSVSATGTGGNKVTITATVNQGTNGLQTLEVNADGAQVASQPVTAAGTYSFNYTFPSSGSHQVSATIIDTALYDSSVTQTVNVIAFNSNGGSQNTLTSRRSFSSGRVR